MKTFIIKASCVLTVCAFLSGASVARAQIPYLPSVGFGGSHAETVVAAALVATVIYAVAQHQATEHQRQLAEQRAQRSYAHMSAQRKANMKAKKVRYIAVDTERGQKTHPKAKKTVMIYDTQTNRVASNVAYDVEKTPSVGSTAKIDNYSAEYVGSGM
ncbi:MAG TPA: hypothetical protein VJU77_17800 [Chthoniobacterales bacterium]|nr:hypothetical protein [Chthoniobacterales bacterium]